MGRDGSEKHTTHCERKLAHFVSSYEPSLTDLGVSSLSPERMTTTGRCYAPSMVDPLPDLRRHTADAVCMQCGLCCDGTFFGSVAVEAHERDKLGRVGLRVVEDNGSLSM